MRKPWLITLIVLAALFVAGALLTLYRARASVERIAPRTGPIVEAIYGLGTVRPERDFELKTSVPVRIVAVYAQEGQPVEAGTPLVKLDESGVFKAPFAGVVTSFPFHVEDTVFAQQPILRLEDLSRRYIEVSLEQRGALRIRRGQTARLVFESLRNDRFQGTVSSVYSRAGDFVARIDVESLPSEVLPGMTADVAIEVARTENALLVPVSSINAGRVLRERDGSREKVELKVGAVDGAWAEVLEGDVRMGDLLIVRKAAAEAK